MTKRLIPISPDFSVDFKHWWLHFYQHIWNLQVGNTHASKKTIMVMLKSAIRAFCIDKGMFVHNNLRTDVPSYDYPSLNSFSAYLSILHDLIQSRFSTSESLQQKCHASKVQANTAMQFKRYLQRNHNKTALTSFWATFAYTAHILNLDALSKE